MVWCVLPFFFIFIGKSNDGICHMSNKKLNAKKFVAGGIKLLQDSNRGRNTISIMNMFRATILLLGNVVVLLVGMALRGVA